MPSSRPQVLAKLAPPRIPRGLRRDRLFSLLHDARAHPVTWVSGPPGAGKTTLVAGYLAEHRTRCLWYQIDRGDADPAALYHYLSRTPVLRRGSALPLPVLTPEYLPDLEEFSRRFFRTLFARLPRISVLVLDNYQEVAADSSFHAAAAVAVDELPPGMRLIAISRAAPPAAFARHVAGGRMLRLGWDELRLTVEETAAIAAGSGIADSAAAAVLHEQCGGWAGGLRLVLEEVRRSGGVQALRHPQTLDTVFDYFAEQVFAAMSVRMQAFLLRTAVLPRMTPAAAGAVSGDAGAGRLLEELYRRHLFIDRRAGERLTYQYHALFRTFLASRAVQSLSPAERQAQAVEAAALLERDGMLEDAFDVSRVAGHWEAIAGLATRHAPRLLAEGRSVTLRSWMDALPGEHVHALPWLSYWLGTSLIPVDQARAVEALERAHRQFRASGDCEGQLLATCGIIEARFLQHSNHRLIDPWLPVHAALLEEASAETSPEAQLRGFSTMLIALLYRQPGHALLETCAQRVLSLLRNGCAAGNARMTAATFAIWYCGYTGDLGVADELIPLGSENAERAEVTPLHRANWLTWLGYYRHCMLEDATALESLERAQAIGEAENLPAVVFLSTYFIGLVQARLGRHDQANRCAQRMEAVASPTSRIQQAILHASRGWAAVERGRGAEALREGELAWQIGADLGSPSYLVHWGTPLVYGLVETGRLQEARERLALQREAMAGTRIRCFDSMLVAIEATIALRGGKRNSASRLAQEAFRLAQEHHADGYLCRVRGWLPALAALLLEQDCKRDYLQELIRRARLTPPSPATPGWPWPRRVAALGRFEVVIEGEPVEFARKAPKRPLALLRALIGAGPDGAAQSTLCDALWPDMEGDAAHRALAITVHRLRVLLGAPEAIAVVGNQVSLDARSIWVDAWAFEAAADAALAARPLPVGAGSAAIALYRGALLPDDLGNGCTLSARERLRSKFIRLLDKLAEAEEAEGRIEAAARLYRLGLDADDLAEPFCRGLMRCCGRLGRVSEGISAYDNLRRVLAATLGRSPSRDTESLYRSLVAQA